MVQGSGADPSSPPPPMGIPFPSLWCGVVVGCPPSPVVWCGVVGLDAHYDSMVEAKMKR